MPQRILRPMDYGAMLDEMFDIYKKNFLLLSGIVGIIYLPMSVIFYSLYMQVFSQLMMDRVPDIASIIILAVIMLLYVPLGYLVVAAITLAISNLYLGKKMTIMESYKAILSRLLPFSLTMILVSLLYGLGFVLCIVPGILLFFVLAFVSQVFIIEGKEYFDCMRRSYELARGEWLKIFVVGIITFVVVMVISAALTSPLQIATVFMKNPFSGPMSIAQGFAQGISQTISLPVQTIAFVLLYYDIRIRKEGFDIEMLAQNINEPEAIIEG